MPPVVGSAGDIIALCNLSVDLVRTLSDCRGSSHSFQQLVKQLHILEAALLQVEDLARRHESSVELNALRVAALQAASVCRSSAGPFHTRIKSYQRYLRLGGSGNHIADVAYKLKWRISVKEDVDSFYGEVDAHSSSLSVLLLKWNM